jgi:hypothetical protein
MRPIFTIHAGEYLVATEIERAFPQLQIWIPSRDTGVDLLVTDRQHTRIAALQVKFSKDYLGAAGVAPSPAVASSGWWTFQRQKIATSPADYWVLVLYQFQSRRYDFVVIPPRELLARYGRIAPGQASIQSYFTVTAKKRCWETRGLDKASKAAVEAGTYSNPDREFSQFLNAWPFKSTKARRAV